ncbi:MAG: amidohydrolase family protein [Terracidiphilus sp.]
MKELSRREVLSAASIGLAAAKFRPAALKVSQAKGPVRLDISDYEPRSMLRLKETQVDCPKFPVIDVHTHLSWSVKAVNGVQLASERKFLATPAELLEVMNRRNIHTLVNLTGGFDDGLEESVARYDKSFPGRFFTFVEPSYNRFLETGYPASQARAIERAHHAGAKGLKILKTLGLYLRENITSGRLVKIDDHRFDPMWETCGRFNMPVAIHVSDPIAFFTPTGRFNERFEELNKHPDWSFYGGDFPSNAELLEARNRVIARHPRTQFIVLHVGNFAEDLVNVSQNLDRFPNMTVDIAARIGELGRQPRAAREFFERYQDRILFGTDAVPHGDEFPQQLFGDKLYQIYYRFLETEDEYFDYAPARIPPQGRWQISGVGLPNSVLRKVYQENAARLLGIET